MLTEHIKGAFWGAALGSALAKSVQNQAREVIVNKYGKVTDFLPVPAEAPAAGMVPEAASGEFEGILYLTRHLIAAQGNPSKKVALEALQEWGVNNKRYLRFLDPTTRYIATQEENPNHLVRRHLWKGSYFCLSTNGLAVRSFPIGLLSHGDLERAVSDTAALCWPEAQNVQTLQAACAMAAAVSCAMQENTSLYDIIQAGFFGAKQAKTLAKEIGCIVHPGPDVEKRMEMAIEAALRSDDIETVLDDLSALIGNCLMAAESIPATFGLLAAGQGDPMKIIIAAVNLGNDTTSAAIMAGAVMGTWKTPSELDGNLLERLILPAGFDLDVLANEIREIGRNR